MNDIKVENYQEQKQEKPEKVEEITKEKEETA